MDGPEIEEVALALAARLRDDADEDVRAAAALALGRAPRVVDRVRDALEAALDDDAEPVRAYAAGCLVHLTVDRTRAVEALIRMIETELGFLATEWAARTLGAFGPTAAGARSVLVDRARRPPSSVRAACLDALASILGASSEVRALIGDALVEPDVEVRLAGLRAIARLRLRDDATIALLRALHTRAEPSVRAEIRAVVAGLADAPGRAEERGTAVGHQDAPEQPDGPDGAAAIQELFDRLARVDDAVELRSVASRLARLGAPDERLVDAIHLRLGFGTTELRASVLAALGDRGAAAADRVDTVLDFLDHEDPWVVTSAALALARIASEDDETLERLLGRLFPSDSPDVDAGFAQVLAELDDARAVSSLLAGLEAASGPIRRASVDALARALERG